MSNMDAIKHRLLKLPHDDNPHRPEFRLWADVDDNGNPTVVLTVGELIGQQKRFAEMSVGEARQLARLIMGITNEIEAIQCAA